MPKRKAATSGASASSNESPSKRSRKTKGEPELVSKISEPQQITKWVKLVQKSPKKAKDSLKTTAESPAKSQTAKPRAASSKSAKPQWYATETDIDPPLMIYRLADVEYADGAAVVGFDLDDTITTPKSGAKFAKGPKDWKYLLDCIPKRLRDLHTERKALVVFTNQAGIEKKHQTVADIQGRIDLLIDDLGIPMSVFVSTGENHYRKPCPVMWDFCLENLGLKGKINTTSSVYVGDAAGRLKDWKPGRKKDFSCSDRKFAANAGIAFKTPEEFFLGESPTSKFEWGFDPKQYAGMKGDEKEYVGDKQSQELVLLVGIQGSGKSQFARTHFVPKGYVHINRDTLHTPAKCVKATMEALESGKSVIVDNTNNSIAARAEYVDIAKQFKVPCRCFHITTPEPLAKHLNYVRQNYTNSAERRVPQVAYNVYKSKFMPPTVKEGFTEVVEVPFAPRFLDDRHERLFKMWT